jgi:hypothetical protein
MRYHRARVSLDRHATYIVATSSPAPAADTTVRSGPRERSRAGILASVTPDDDDLARLVDLEPELRYLLNRWDPIGVYDEKEDFPPDEYDCLLAPILSRLAAGTSAIDLEVRTNVAGADDADPHTATPSADRRSTPSMMAGGRMLCGIGQPRWYS